MIARLVQRPLCMPFEVAPAEPLLGMSSNWEIALCNAAIAVTSGGVGCVVGIPLVNS